MPNTCSPVGSWLPLNQLVTVCFWIPRAVATWTAPAVAYLSLRWGFVYPTFPRPVIYDLEEIVRDYLPLLPASLKPLLNSLDDNLKDWRNHFAKPTAIGPEYFDNLAVAGSTMDEVNTLSYQNTLTTRWSWYAGLGPEQRCEGQTQRRSGVGFA
jgi:hypothetical protein